MQLPRRPVDLWRSSSLIRALRMISSFQGTSLRLPAQHCFCSLGGRVPRSGGRIGGGRRVTGGGLAGGQCRAGGLQSWFTEDRRLMLKSIVVGIVGASFMRGGTALAAVNRQAYAEVCTCTTRHSPDFAPHTTTDTGRVLSRYT